MNLKEAFRYQNFLSDNIMMITNFLSNESNVMDIVETHKINSVIKDKEDKEIHRIEEKEYNYPVMDIVDFMLSLLNEKEALTSAITKAKASLDIDIDGIVSNNKDMQFPLRVLRTLSQLKNRKREAAGNEYTFNAEGNQIQVRYPVDIVSTINYDRNAVKAIEKRLRKKVDETSNARDIAMVNTVVEGFTSTYDVNDTLEEMLDAFIASK